MKICTDTCSGCYWYGKCDSDLPCDDYTPLDIQDDVEYYQNALSECDEDYRSVIDEMSD